MTDDAGGPIGEVRKAVFDALASLPIGMSGQVNINITINSYTGAPSSLASMNGAPPSLADVNAERESGEGSMTTDIDVVLIHGFWSSASTWDKVLRGMRDNPELASVKIHAFPYESPKLRFRLPWSGTRIPDYDDIAQSLPNYIHAVARPHSKIIFVTHSQGGLILQRFFAWMLAEGRGREIARTRLVVMLSCPNEGSEFLATIRAITGFTRHPQARDLVTLSADVGEARRIMLRQIVNAKTADDRQCPIPVHVFSGRTDSIVSRQSAQSVFPHADVLPGDHFSILDVDEPGNLTVPTLTRLVRQAMDEVH